MKKRIAVGLVLFAALFAVLMPPSHAAGISDIHVSGNHIVDSANTVTVPRGVNHAGTEYNCVKNAGIFSGPTDTAAMLAYITWNVKIVRIPLNEDCWLGINGVNPSYSGASYRSAIATYVASLHQYGIRAELSLMWAAPGSILATHQDIAPDADHSPAVWASLAQTFAGDNADILAPFSEEHTGNAQCFYWGGCTTTDYGVSFQVAGLQEAVTRMRASGYTGIIAIPCASYANYCPPINQYLPFDPQANLVVEAHIYGNGGCGSVSCQQSLILPIARTIPVIYSETGETYNDAECGSLNMQAEWAVIDPAGIGWMSWTWNTWSKCEGMIADYRTGAPKDPYAVAVRQKLLSYDGFPIPTPTVTPLPSPTPTATPTPPPGGAQLSGLTVADATNAKYWSLQTNLQVGAVQYGDRGYTLATVPASLAGSAWIRASMASKAYVGSPLVSVTINQAATVYVATDVRVKTLPSWLDSTWSLTALTLTDGQAAGSNSYVLYAKVFPAGVVTLGPNDSGTTGVNQYTVIVR